MAYEHTVAEARLIIKRSESDQWRLAELTWQALHEHDRTTREWAEDIGVSQSTVSRWARAWEQWMSHSDSDRPRFADAIAEVMGRPEDPQERREADAIDTVSSMPAQRRAEVAEDLLADPEVRSAYDEQDQDGAELPALTGDGVPLDWTYEAARLCSNLTGFSQAYQAVRGRFSDEPETVANIARQVAAEVTEIQRMVQGDILTDSEIFSDPQAG